MIFHTNVSFHGGVDASAFGNVGEQKIESLTTAVRKARSGYLFPIRVVGVIRGECAFFFGSYSLRKRLVPDLIITRNS